MKRICEDALLFRIRLFRITTMQRSPLVTHRVGVRSPDSRNFSNFGRSPRQQLSARFLHWSATITLSMSPAFAWHHDGRRRVVHGQRPEEKPRRRGLNIEPVHDPAAAVVMHANAGDIGQRDGRGTVEKRAGKLLVEEIARKLEKLRESGDRITHAMGLRAATVASSLS